MTNGRMHFDYCYTCCYTRSVHSSWILDLVDYYLASCFTAV
jgi:hypothetical protein